MKSPRAIARHARRPQGWPFAAPILLWAACAAAPSKAGNPPKPLRNQTTTAAAPIAEASGDDISFYGWAGNDLVIQHEGNGSVVVPGPGGVRRGMKLGKDLKLLPGRMLVEAGKASPGFPQVSLEVAAHPDSLLKIRESVVEFRAEEHPMFVDIQLAIHYLKSDGASPAVLGRVRKSLHTVTGEAQFELHEPELLHAGLSPDGSRLAVRIRLNGGSEILVFALP